MVADVVRLFLGLNPDADANGARQERRSEMVDRQAMTCNTTL